MCSGSAAGLQKRLLGRHRHGRAAVDIQYLVRYLKKLKNPMNIRSKCPYPPLATTCLISRCRCWQLSRTSGQSSASPLTSWSPWRRTSPRSSAAIRVITNGGGYNFSSNCPYHISSFCRRRNKPRCLQRHHEFKWAAPDDFDKLAAGGQRS